MARAAPGAGAAAATRTTPAPARPAVSRSHTSRSSSFRTSGHGQRDQPRAPFFRRAGSAARDRITATTARANRLRVTCRCHPTQLRTSYSSSPQSPLASSKHSSIAHRVPATRTNSASVVAGRAAAGEVRHLGRVRHAPPDQQPPGVRRPARGSWSASTAQSYTRGPFAPSPQLSRCQASAGTSASSAFDPHLPEPGPDGEVGPHPDHVPQPVVLDGRCGSGSPTRTPRRPSPTSPAPRPPPPARSSAGPARSWWRTRPPRAPRPPPAGRRRRPTPSAGTAPGRAAPGPSRVAYPRNTPTWQFSIRPAVPEYWRATPPTSSPSSGTRSRPRPARRPGRRGARPRSRIRSSRTASASQSARASRCCTPSGVGSPRCSASCQPFFRSVVAEQPADVPDGPPPRLAPGEVPADPLADRRQLVRPRRHLRRRRSS